MSTVDCQLSAVNCHGVTEMLYQSRGLAPRPDASRICTRQHPSAPRFTRLGAEASPPTRNLVSSLPVLVSTRTSRVNPAMPRTAMASDPPAGAFSSASQVSTSPRGNSNPVPVMQSGSTVASAAVGLGSRSAPAATGWLLALIRYGSSRLPSPLPPDILSRTDPPT